MGDVIGVDDKDVLEVWDFISHSIKNNEMFTEVRPPIFKNIFIDSNEVFWNVCLCQCYFGRNISCNQRGRWEKIYNYMGVCYSYTLSISVLLLPNRQLITVNFRFLFVRRISNQHDRLIQQFIPEGKI